MSRSPLAPEATAAPAATYLGIILQEAPRVLGLMDREALSATAGCCDRTYWAWKFIDFPGARFQEAVWVLAFLYTAPLPDSPYHGSAKLLEWIGYALRFWSKIQHADGSFDEAYPFERSLAATAFTSFYVSEALALVGDHLPSDTVSRTRATLIRAGRWLMRNDETHGFLSNHLAAAAAALRHIYRLSGDDTFEARSRYFLGRIMGHQSSEGWYEEYGGADPGYQTHGSFYLARCWQLTRRPELADSLRRAMTFQAHFVHIDGSLGGEYASRNTQTYYPAAFEMFAGEHPAAAWIAETMRPSVQSGAAAGLHSVDAYNYFPLLNNLVFAYLACADPARIPLPAEEPSAEDPLVWFPQAGIARIRRSRYDAYVGAAKAGVTKVFDRQRRQLVYNDCGYVGRLRDGHLFSSQHEDHRRTMRVGAERIEVEGTFVEFSRPTMAPAMFLAFRLFTLSLGRLPRLAAWLKRQLVKVLIYRRRALDIAFKRTIEFAEDRISVSDRIEGPDGERVAHLGWGAFFTTIHMGSSRYFINNELIELPDSEQKTQYTIDPKDIASGVTARRVIAFTERGTYSVREVPIALVSVRPA
jgi:hypothetical protein